MHKGQVFGRLVAALSLGSLGAPCCAQSVPLTSIPIYISAWATGIGYDEFCVDGVCGSSQFGVPIEQFQLTTTADLWLLTNGSYSFDSCIGNGCKGQLNQLHYTIHSQQLGLNDYLFSGAGFSQTFGSFGNGGACTEATVMAGKNCETRFIVYSANTFDVVSLLPETTTWATMLLGFLGIGWTLRRQRKGEIVISANPT